MYSGCEICGSNRGLDRHHVVPKRMGGSKDPDVQSDANLMTLCRTCHQNIHDELWDLVRTEEGIRVIDCSTGEVIMRRLINPDLDVPSLFQLFNLTEESLSQLLGALPYFNDEQLVEAFAYACSFGKRSWLIQAAILYEAQKRSTYGEQTLEAIARRFEIGIRQAQKYALVWNLFFTNHGEEESVNIDAISLDEPSWYVVAATETKEPELWLAYAQDRKAADPRYSVAAFRRDIQVSRLIQGVGDEKEMQQEGFALPDLKNTWSCPWIRLFCVHSGTAVPYRECEKCDFDPGAFGAGESNGRSTSHG